MQLYYCAKCGLRLTNQETAQIAPEEPAANIVCAACAPPPLPALKPVEALVPVPASRSTPHTPAVSPRQGSARPRSDPRARTTAAGSGASARAVNRSGQSGQSGQNTATRSGSQPSTRKSTLLYGLGGVGVIVLLIGIVLATSGEKKTDVKEKVAQADAPKPDSQASRKSDTPRKSDAAKVEKPGETKPDAKTAAEPPPRSAFSPVPVDDPALSPKEDYERRMRSGLARNSGAAAPAPEAQKANGAEALPSGPLPAYSADDANWRLLFNGKDLSGWHEEKGHYNVEDGCLIHDTAKGNADLATDATYGDFDLNFKAMSAGGNRYAEVNIRNLSFVFGFNFENFNQWREIRVSARGAKVRATADGQELTPDGASGTATSGEIGIYCPAASQLKVKDIAIRTAH